MTVRLEALDGGWEGGEVEHEALEKILHDIKVSARNRSQHQRFM